MGKYSSSRAQQAAIAVSKKSKGGSRGKAGKSSRKDKGRFPGDVNRDGRVNGADFRLARKMGRLR